MLGSITFNVQLWDLFILMSDTDLGNFADDNSPHMSAEITKNLV